jgi:hypothetical protein
LIMGALSPAIRMMRTLKGWIKADGGARTQPGARSFRQ